MSDRKMPDPWFKAETRAQPIEMMVRLFGGEPLRVANAGIGERQLGPFVLPPFQRPPVWTQSQQIRLIESIWGALPIGVYVYNQASLDHPCDGWLLDGQQRVTAILAYVSNSFPVFGWTFAELSKAEQRSFSMKPVPALITSLTTKAECLEVYDRLAYGGTPHQAP